MYLHGKRSNSRSCSCPMGDPKGPSDLIGEHLDPQAGDKTSQHRAGQKVGKKGQPKKPEHKKQQPGQQGNSQGILQSHRIINRSKSYQCRRQERGDGSIRACNNLAGTGEDGEQHEWNNARIETGCGGQTSQLGISNIERDDHRRQCDAGGDLPREISDFGPA